MKVTVKMFAAARDAAGAPEVTVEVVDGATVADLRTALIANYPQLASLVNRAMFAVKAYYANDDDVLPSNGEIACIPPVSGG